MREIDWTVMVPVLGQMLFNLVLLSLGWTLLGIFAMKYFVRQVPLLTLAIILFWAIFRVLLVAAILIIVGLAFNSSFGPGPFAGFFGVAGMCAVGWLITRRLAKDYGIPTKFPAVGAKVVFSILVLMWIIVGAMYALPGVFS